MKRRDLIKALFASSIPFHAFGRRSPFQNYNRDTKVLIVGAGAAGLYAGNLLEKAGIDFQILEASDRIGGRLQKLEGFAGYPLDLGAQWLHGRKSLVGDLIKSKGVEITKDDSEGFYWFEENLRSDLPIDLEKWLRKGYLNSMDLSYLDYAKREGLSDSYFPILEMLAGDYGASASELSLYWSQKEEENWSSGRHDYKFRNTYYDVVINNFSPKQSNKVLLNKEVKAIEYDGEGVKIFDQESNQYDGDYCIVTAPISILQKQAISFSPTLPLEKIKAINTIGIGPGIKVFLKFRKSFYPENIYGGKVCASYSNEIVGKIGDTSVLMAFIMGDQASSMTSFGSKQKIIASLLEELDMMFKGQASKYYLDAYIQDWGNEPYIQGAYSYAKVETKNARAIAAQKLNNCLFFAGEAMNTKGHHQTVHGALETARLVVDQILAVERR